METVGLVVLTAVAMSVWSWLSEKPASQEALSFDERLRAAKLADRASARRYVSECLEELDPPLSDEEFDAAYAKMMKGIRRRRKYVRITRDGKPFTVEVNYS